MTRMCDVATKSARREDFTDTSSIFDFFLYVVALDFQITDTFLKIREF